MVHKTNLKLVPYGVFDYEESIAVKEYLHKLYEVISLHDKVAKKDFPIIYLWGIGTSGLSLCIFAKRYLKSNPEINVYINPLPKKEEKTHRSLPKFYEDGLNIFLDDCIESGNTIFDVQRRFGFQWDMLFVSGRVNYHLLKQMTNFTDIYVGNV